VAGVERPKAASPQRGGRGSPEKRELVFPRARAFNEFIYLLIYGVLQQIMPRIGCIRAEHDIQQQDAIFLTDGHSAIARRYAPLAIGQLTSLPMRASWRPHGCGKILEATMYGGSAAI
jgi:hypothetical protein